MADAGPRSNPARPRLGELLMQGGLLTPEQLGLALEDQRAMGGRLGHHVVQRGFVTEEALLGALSTQLRIPRIDLDAPDAVAPDAQRYARADLTEQWGFCPVSFDARSNVLVVAISEPEPQLISDIEGLLALRIEPRLAPAAAIERAARKLFRSTDAPVKRISGLQVARGEQKNLAPEADTQPPAAAPRAAPAAPPAATVPTMPAVGPLDPRVAQQLALQQIHLQQLQLQAHQAAVQAQAFASGYVQPVMQPGLAGPHSMPPPAAAYGQMAHPSYPPYATLPGIQPAPNGYAPGPVSSPEEMKEQLDRLERALSAQARALRSLVEVLVDKGLLSKVEMARKQQNVPK